MTEPNEVSGGRRWMTGFRYIAPYDYNTPLMHLPMQRTILYGKTKEAAWESFLNDEFMGPRDYYRLEEIWEDL